MEPTRIKDTKNYKGNTDGFATLNAAIWAKAVECEYKYQKARMFLDTSEKIFNVLARYDKDSRNTFVKVERIVGKEYGLAGAKLAKRLELIIDEHGKQIKRAVQNKIYEESIKWPDSIKNKKDPEYEKEYAKIRDNILNSFDTGGR